MDLNKKSGVLNNTPQHIVKALRPEICWNERKNIPGLRGSKSQKTGFEFKLGLNSDYYRKSS